MPGMAAWLVTSTACTDPGSGKLAGTKLTSSMGAMTGLNPLAATLAAVCEATGSGRVTRTDFFERSARVMVSHENVCWAVGTQAGAKLHAEPGGIGARAFQAAL